MKKALIGLFCFLGLLLSSEIFAEIDIPKEKRVKNFPSGCCVWCAIENLANVHGIKQLEGIAKYRHDNYSKVKKWIEGGYMIDSFGRWVQYEGSWGYVNDAPGTVERVLSEFERLNVKYYWIQDHNNYNLDIIKESVDEKLGCAIGVRNFPQFGDYHMLNLTHLDNKECIFIDNNGKCERYVATRAWFDNHWTGYAILLYPEPKN